MRAERASRLKNPALLFHLVVLLLVLASIAAAGGKESACGSGEGFGLAAVRCQLEHWGAGVLGGRPPQRSATPALG